MRGPRNEGITGRRERIAAVLLALLIGVLELVLAFAFIRGSEENSHFGATSHFVTTLANVQREVLHLQLTVVDADSARHQRNGVEVDRALEGVRLQRAILNSHLRALRGGISGSAEAEAVYDGIVRELQSADPALDLVLADPSQAKLSSLKVALAGLELNVKRAYDGYEFAYFRRTADTLSSQAVTQLLLLIVGFVIALLGMVLAFVLLRRVRAEFAHAYYRLEAEVQQRTQAEKLLRHQAYHDPLTGLPNRVAFGEKLAAALADDAAGVAVLFVDLDDFKAINDALGHAAGDEVLAAAGQRLTAALRQDDVAARLGGDEFAILLTRASDSSQAAAVAERALQALHEPVQLAGRTLFLQASVGVAMAQAGDLEADELMRNADIAMYLAKSQGKDRSQFYQPSMHTDVLRRLALRADLEAAVNGDGLVVHYQPIVDLASGRINGVEALVRWMHPERGLISPAEFIPLAETTGLIVPLGRWVLGEACRQLAAWRRELDADLRVSINISPVQLKHPTLLQDVHEAISQAGLAPQDVILEITETGVVENGAASTVLFALRDLGVRIAMDDFGTGYSSLGHIGRLPVDIIKIDRTFIQALGRGTKETALTATIVRLANSLNIATVAEGVEDSDQLARIRALGCEAAQGYLMSRPMPADVASRFLASNGMGRPVPPERKLIARSRWNGSAGRQAPLIDVVGSLPRAAEG